MGHFPFFDPISELTNVNLVIRLGKVKQSAFFRASPCRSRIVFSAFWLLKRQQAMPSGVVLLPFWLSGEVQLCTEFIEHVSRQRGPDLTTEGL